MPVNVSLTDRDSLWTLTIAPLVWAVHFLFVYVFAAVICAKASGAGGALGFGAIRAGIAIATVVAIAVIAWAGIVSFRRWQNQATQAESRLFTAHDRDTVESRRRFMAFSAALLSGLSLVAVSFQAMPAIFISTCA